MNQAKQRHFRNPLYSLDLASGTPYALLRMRAQSSSFGGYHDVISSCVSQTGTGRERDRSSCLRGLHELDESRSFSGEAGCGQKLILARGEWRQSSRNKMGTRTF